MASGRFGWAPLSQSSLTHKDHPKDQSRPSSRGGAAHSRGRSSSFHQHHGAAADEGADEEEVKSQIGEDFDHIKDLLTLVDRRPNFAQYAFPKIYRDKLNHGYLHRELDFLRETILRQLHQSADAEHAASETTAPSTRPAISKRLDSIDGDHYDDARAENMRDWQRKYEEVFDFLGRNEEGHQRLEALYSSTSKSLADSREQISRLTDLLRRNEENLRQTTREMKEMKERHHQLEAAVEQAQAKANTAHQRDQERATQVSKLKEEHEEQVRNMRNDHDRSIAQKQEEHENTTSGFESRSKDLDEELRSSRFRHDEAMEAIKLKHDQSMRGKEEESTNIKHSLEAQL